MTKSSQAVLSHPLSFRIVESVSKQSLGDLINTSCVFLRTRFLGQVPQQSPSYSTQSIRIEFLSVTTHRSKLFASPLITSHFLCYIESVDDIFTRRSCLCGSKFLKRSCPNVCVLVYTGLLSLNAFSRGLSPSSGFLFSLFYVFSVCFVIRFHFIALRALVSLPAYGFLLFLGLVAHVSIILNTTTVTTRYT